ncbi:hypothetical protein FSW04_03490 [Baekduia soli]|uniref:PepSY domain-containing protein n=1 Tax=Baekduia soli TaxID=496014 RepID=A0A5B8U135_9ACTN|nr:hypothetical protein [Baekduia soli]QEC46739.1 hypothetical protein FSW04_03490 [Baekduia soli]
MSQPIKKVLAGVAGLAALALGGAALAGAATSSSTTTPGGTTTQGRPSFPAPGTATHEDAEKPVTGDAADKAKAAAVTSVGSGSTAGAVTTDFPGTGYEVTVTKADGAKVEVHLGKDFTVMQRGPGGRGPGRPHGRPDGDGPGGPGLSSGSYPGPGSGASASGSTT